MTDQTHTGAQAAPHPARPWDPVVRLTHWTLAAAVIANGLLSEPGGAVHVWIGWAALAVLALRLFWGLIGPPEARFTAFLPDPRAAIAHLVDLLRGRPREEHASHNPAGALMAYALWACLAVVIATGLVMTGGRSPVAIAEEKAAVAAGDWSVLLDENESAGHDESGVGDIVEEVHETVANLMLLLAILHVGGVVVESRALGRNLVRGMIMGRRK